MQRYLFSHPIKQNLFSCPLVEQKAVLSGEEQERKITTYEDAMNKIKDTTGVSDIKEVVQRFLSQGETQKHLEQLKTNNEKMLVRLKEEKVQQLLDLSSCWSWENAQYVSWSFSCNVLFCLFICLLNFSHVITLQEKLRMEYEEMKYSGEAKLSRYNSN